MRTGEPRRMRLLKQEHERHTIEGLRELFGERGFECEVALSLPTARRILRERRMDIAVLNSSVDDVDEIDLIGELRAKYPRMKLVVYQGVKDKTHQRRMRNLGADSYLSESSDLGALARAATRVLGKR